MKNYINWNFWQIMINVLQDRKMFPNILKKITPYSTTGITYHKSNGTVSPSDVQCID